MAFLKESTQIKKLFSSLNKNDEFEVMFNNYKQDNKLSFNKFMNMLKYLKWKSDTEDYKINFEESLDISYNYENNSVYRVSVLGNENINNFLNLVHLRKNHIIFSILFTQFINNKNFDEASTENARISKSSEN